MADHRVEATFLQWQAIFNHRNQIHITIPVLVVFKIAHNFTSRHSVIAFTIPTLLGFLQIQCVGEEPSPFQLHPVTIRASVISVLGYYMAYVAKLWLPNHAFKLGILMSVFGSFSVASLGSLLLPHSLWNLRYVFYVVFMVAELHQSLGGTIYERYVRGLSHRRRQQQRLIAGRRLLPQTYTDLMDEADISDGY